MSRNYRSLESWDLPGPFNSSKHRHRFVDAFLVLTFRGRVSDEPSASLHIGNLFFQHHGAQSDTGIQIAVETKISYRSGVDPAFPFLQFVNKLHRANLRGPG